MHSEMYYRALLLLESLQVHGMNECVGFVLVLFSGWTSDRVMQCWDGNRQLFLVCVQERAESD